MKNKIYILVVVILLAVLFASPVMAADPKPAKEYQVKAAFLYNFTKFIDWPKEKEDDTEKPKTSDKIEDVITIGIIGKSPFGNAFDPILKKKGNDKKLIIKTFGTFKDIKKTDSKDKRLWNKQTEALRECHLLFFCASEQDSTAEIIKTLRDDPILTVGETEDFIKKGGIVKFVVDKKKIQFEVNMTAAEKTGLNIRSKLLRLAKKVIKKEKTKDIKS